MFKAIVRGAGVDEVCAAKLFKIAQALEMWGVDCIKYNSGYLKMTVDWVVNDWVRKVRGCRYGLYDVRVGQGGRVDPYSSRVLFCQLAS